MTSKPKTNSKFCIAMVTAAGLMMTSVPASAAVPSADRIAVPGTFGPSLAATVEAPRAEPGIQVAKKRKGHRRAKHHGKRHNKHRRHRGGRGGYYYGGGFNPGAAAAAGIVGLAAGAIAGSALAGPQETVVIDDYYGGVPAPYTAEWYRQCDLKYNSFRASDGTFMGYDNVRKTCRLP